MKSDLYQQKTSALHTPVSCLSPFFFFSPLMHNLHLVLLHSSLFLPLICISQITSLLPLHLMFLIRPSLHTWIQFLPQLVCCLCVCLWVCMCVQWYDTRQKVISRDCSPQLCASSVSANRMLEQRGFMRNKELVPEIEPFSSEGPQRVGYGSNNESRASLATKTHTCLHS